VYTEMLLRLYRGGAEVGRPPYNPSVMLKMLLLSYLYGLSERLLFPSAHTATP